MKPLNLPGEDSINDDEDEPQKAPTLPDHLILNNILPRLPVKPLLRFKSVCRNWRSSISDPHFSKLCLSFSRSCHQFLLLQKNAIAESSNFCLVRKGIEIGGNFTRVDIAGCCSGLLCFYPMSPCSGAMKFYVLNPATRQQVEILWPGGECLKDCYTWFGYISSIDDYKIVAFNLQKGVIWIYSWKGGIWKTISCSIDICGGFATIKSRDPVVLVDDCVYWPLNVFKWRANEGTYILELNLVSDNYEIKPRTMFTDFTDFTEGAKLVNLKGCLAVHVTSSRYKCISVWKLKHKDDWNSWEKVDSKNLGYCRVIYYSTTGKLVVEHKRQLKVVDDLSQLPPQGEESSELGKILFKSLPSANGVRDYVESLISLA